MTTHGRFEWRDLRSIDYTRHPSSDDSTNVYTEICSAWPYVEPTRYGLCASRLGARFSPRSMFSGIQLFWLHEKRLSPQVIQLITRGTVLSKDGESCVVFVIYHSCQVQRDHSYASSPGGRQAPATLLARDSLNLHQPYHPSFVLRMRHSYMPPITHRTPLIDNPRRLSPKQNAVGYAPSCALFTMDVAH